MPSDRMTNLFIQIGPSVRKSDAKQSKTVEKRSKNSGKAVPAAPFRSNFNAGGWPKTSVGSEFTIAICSSKSVQISRKTAAKPSENSQKTVKISLVESSCSS